MAIGLASAIGLGGKRESVISDLGKGISDIGEGIERGRLAQAKQQAQMDAIAADTASKLATPTGKYTDADAAYIGQKANEYRNDLMLKARQGYSSSQLQSESQKYAYDLAQLSKKAEDLYNFGVEASVLAQTEQYDMTDVDRAAAELQQIPLPQRPSGEKYKEILGMALPKQFDVVEAIKTGDKSFDIEQYDVKTKIEGTDKFKQNKEMWEKDKPLLIMKAMSDPKYSKNVELRTRQMASELLNLMPAPERTPENLDFMRQNIKEGIVQDDLNRAYDQMIMRREKDRAINLPSQGKGLNINFGAGGVTINDETTFVAQPTQPIDKEAQAKLKKLREELYKEVSFKKKLQANLESPKATPEYKKLVQNQIERTDARISILKSSLNKSEKENVESFRNTYTLLNVMKKSGAERGSTFFDEKGGKIEGISRVDNIVFDPETGVPVSMIGTQKVGDTEQPITIPVNPTNVGILNSMMKNSLLSHVQKHQEQNHLRPESVSALGNLLVTAQKIGSGAKETTKQESQKKEGVKKESTTQDSKTPLSPSALGLKEPGSRAETSFASKGAEMQPKKKMYTIKGTQYTFEELTTGMGYTEQEIEPYKNK